VPAKHSKRCGVCGWGRCTSPTAFEMCDGVSSGSDGKVPVRIGLVWMKLLDEH
jgi:hypothetical protein